MKRAMACGLPLVASFAAPALGLADAPKPQALRYDEDWRPACSSDASRSAAALLKCIGDPQATLLTLGGELRERFETVSNPAYGVAHDKDRVFLHRVLLHGDLHAGPSFRAFVQLGYLDESGRRLTPAPTDIDQLDLMQGFAEVSTSLRSSDLTFRAGRQEVALGSSRLVSVRDGPNARRAFDGVRAFAQTFRTRLDLFYLRPVDTAPGTFDNSTSSTEALYGGYLVRKLGQAATIDLYVLGYRKNLARFAALAGREVRASYGLRFAGRARGFDWNFEGVIQHGTLATRPVRAWTLASDTGFTFASAMHPRLGVKVDIASGNRNGSTGTFGTFNALYPRLPYLSEANLLVPANLVDVHPQISFKPVRRIELLLGADFAWRETARDAVFLFPLTPLAKTAGMPGRFTGRQAISEVSVEIAPNVLASASYVHFEPGLAVRNAGGHSGNFGLLAVDWKW